MAFKKWCLFFYNIMFPVNFKKHLKVNNSVNFQQIWMIQPPLESPGLGLSNRDIFTKIGSLVGEKIVSENPVCISEFYFRFRVSGSRFLISGTCIATCQKL